MHYGRPTMSKVQLAPSMAKYKPGSATGSAEGRGSTTNQREMLATPPLVDLHLMQVCSKLSGHIGQLLHNFLIVLPTPSRLN